MRERIPIDCNGNLIGFASSVTIKVCEGPRFECRYAPVYIFSLNVLVTVDILCAYDIQK